MARMRALFRQRLPRCYPGFSLLWRVRLVAPSAPSSRTSPAPRLHVSIVIGRGCPEHRSLLHRVQNVGESAFRSLLTEPLVAEMLRFGRGSHSTQHRHVLRTWGDAVSTD